MDGRTIAEWESVLTHPRFSGLRSLELHSASLPCAVLPALGQLTALTLARNTAKRQLGIIHSEFKETSLFDVVHQLTALRTLRIDSCDPGVHVAPRLPPTLTDLSFISYNLPDEFDFEAALKPLLHLRRFESSVRTQLSGRRMLTALARLSLLERICLAFDILESGAEICALVSDFLSSSSKRPAEQPKLRITELTFSHRNGPHRALEYTPTLVVMEAVAVAAAGGSPAAATAAADAALSSAEDSSCCNILRFTAPDLRSLHTLDLDAVPFTPQCLTELLDSIAPHTLRSFRLRSAKVTPECWQSPERSLWTFVANHARTLQQLEIIEQMRLQQCSGGFDAVAAAALSQMHALRSFQFHAPLQLQSCGALVLVALSSLPALANCDLKADGVLLDSTSLRTLASSASLRTLRLTADFDFSATVGHALTLRLLEDTQAVDCFWLNQQSRAQAELRWRVEQMQAGLAHTAKPLQRVAQPPSSPEKTKAKRKCVVQ